MQMCVYDIGIVEQYKACCHFYYRQSCYFIFSFELDMSVLSTSFKFGRLASISLKNEITLYIVVCIYIYIYIHTQLYIYIYIYIYI